MTARELLREFDRRNPVSRLVPWMTRPGNRWSIVLLGLLELVTIGAVVGPWQALLVAVAVFWLIVLLYVVMDSWWPS